MTSVSEETRLENDEHPSVQQDDVETPMAPRLEEPSEESLRKDEGEPIEPSKKVEIIPEDVPASVPESDPPDDTTPNMKGSSSNGPVVDNESPAPIATEETTRPETVTIPANLTEQAVEELSKWTGNDDSSARLLERLNRGLEIPISHVLDVDYQSSSLATNPPDTPRLTSEVQSRSSTASFSRSSLYRQIDESLRDGVSPEEQNELINVRLALGLANPPHVEVSSNILDRSSSVVPLGPSTPKSAAWSTGESSWDSNDRLNGTGDATPTKEYPPSSNTGPIKEPSSVTETNNPSDPQQGITEEDLPAQSDPRDMLSTRLEIGLQTPVQAKSISLPAPTESVTALPPSTPRPEDLSSSSSDSLTRDLEIQNGDSLAPALHATDTLPTEEKENEKPDVAQQSSYVSTPPSQNDPEQLAIDPSVPPDSHIEATPAVVDDGPDNVGVSPVSRSLVPDKAAPLAPEEPLDRVDQPGEIVDEVSKPLAEEESKNEVHSDSVPKGSGDGAPTEGDGDVSVKGTSSAIPDAEPQAVPYGLPAENEAPNRVAHKSHDTEISSQDDPVVSEVEVASDFKAGKPTNETENADAEVPPTPVSVALEETPATTASEEVLERGNNLGDAREESQTSETAAISNAERELAIGPFEEARIEVTEPTPSEPPDKDSIFNPFELKPQQLSHAADIVYVETPAGSDHSAPLGIPGARRNDYLSSGSSFDLVGVATGSEPPQIVSSVPKDGHLIPIVIKETNDDEEGRPEVQRLLSTTPEAPTSPRDELEDTSHIATPTITPVRIQESIPYTTPDTTQESIPVPQSVPTVAVTAPKEGLDFVDDARSDRSVGTSVAPIAPNSPRFITPLPTPSVDSTEFSLYQANGSTIDGPTQPLTESAVDKLPESMDPVAELAPELKEALDSTVIEKAHLRALDENDGEIRHTQLEPVTEDGMTSVTQHSTMRSSRPRHSSSPSTWSINRSSGWFHPGANIPGRPSLEIVEGEFTRPQPRSASAAYPAAYPPDAVSPATGKAKDDERCVIF